MTRNSFIWVDLSTFDIQATKAFYNHCFGWQYSELENDYLVSEIGNEPVSALYTMPEKFQKIGMPSFWMSYIQVADIQKTVVLAEEYGAKIELGPQTAPGGGLIALIRDPAGAGFTCYEGNGLESESRSNRLGCVNWNELHISDLTKVKSFYSKLFDWEIRPDKSTNRYLIYRSSASTNPIAGIQVNDNSVKGDKEYWGVYFAVDSIPDTSECIKKNGGEIVAEQPLGDRPASLVYDPQGAAFYLLENALTLDLHGLNNRAN